ncbi:MAG: cyclic nucleotide-binding domain-containing protein [Actinomycetia bacterium]|nr:cyclic nucleotide-binding domain-containing protein [Actinomycetes bacterium]
MLPKPVRSNVFRLPGFSELSARDRRLIIRSSHAMAFVEGTMIIEQGHVDRRVLIVLDGVVELFVDDATVGHAGRGTLLGAIVAGSARVSATAVAVTNVRTVQMPSLLMRSLADRSSTVAYWLARDAEERRDHNTS